MNSNDKNTLTTKRPSSASACESCPWRYTNHGKPHHDGWYTKVNLKRLWGGLRRGESMICHDTDPDQGSYGGTKTPEPGHERQCVGALILIYRHIKRLEQKPFKAYRQDCKTPMTRKGLGCWLERIMFADLASVAPLPKSLSGLKAIGVPRHQQG